MKLPCEECRGQCCTYPGMSKREFKRIRKAHGVPKDSKAMPVPGGMTVVRDNGDCGYLVDGRCSVYELRPETCRQYGINPSLPCQFLFPEKAMAAVDQMLARQGVRS